MRKQILIIEPKDDLSALLSSYLSEHYEIWSCKSGIAALKRLHSGGIPNMILCTTYLPDIPALDFVSSIQDSWLFSTIPIIVLEATFPDPFADKFARLLGENQCYKQPFNPVLMHMRIETLLSSHPQT
jgi:DNA-binding response OmpR family regulator